MAFVLEGVGSVQDVLPLHEKQVADLLDHRLGVGKTVHPEVTPDSINLFTLLACNHYLHTSLADYMFIIIVKCHGIFICRLIECICRLLVRPGELLDLAHKAGSGFASLIVRVLDLLVQLFESKPDGLKELFDFLFVPFDAVRRGLGILLDDLLYRLRESGRHVFERILRQRVELSSKRFARLLDELLQVLDLSAAV